MEVENVNSKANAGLTTGIIGTSLAGLLALGNNLGGLLGGGGTSAAVTGLAAALPSALSTMANNSNYVTKDELKFVQDIAAKDAEISLLKSESNTETKMIEVYKQAHTEIAALRDIVTANQNAQNAWNTSQSVANANISAAIAANTTSITNLEKVLGGITATYVPAAQITPQPMDRYNSWTAPTTTTATTSGGSTS